MQPTVLEARNICKSFHDPVTIPILNDVSFAIQRGDFVSVVGKPGCGKSTLLYILSTMDTDYEGDFFGAMDLMKLGRWVRADDVFSKKFFKFETTYDPEAREIVVDPPDGLLELNEI